MQIPFSASLHDFFQGGHGLRVCFHDAVCPGWILGRNPWERMRSRENPLYLKLSFLSFGQCTPSSIHKQYFRFTGKKGQ